MHCAAGRRPHRPAGQGERVLLPRDVLAVGHRPVGVDDAGELVRALDLARHGRHRVEGGAVAAEQLAVPHVDRLTLVRRPACRSSGAKQMRPVGLNRLAVAAAVAAAAAAAAAAVGPFSRKRQAPAWFFPASSTMVELPHEPSGGPEWVKETTEVFSTPGTASVQMLRKAGGGRGAGGGGGG